MEKVCIHCSTVISAHYDGDFCCMGCAAAYNLIHNLKLDKYYEYCRAIYSTKPNKINEVENKINYLERVVENGDRYRISLCVEGLHCGACVWLIENTLQQQPGVMNARLNLSTHRLFLEWVGDKGYVSELIHIIEKLGYRAVPFIAESFCSQSQIYQKHLLKCLTVAAAASAQVMAFAIAVWFGTMHQSIGENTRALLNMLSALISVPAVVYAGQPFFRSALNALRHKRSNMDVPISVGAIAATIISIQETVIGHCYTYYDAAIGLIFVLLIGRYLDLRVRNSANSTAHNLILSQPSAVAIFENNKYQLINVNDAKVNQIAYVAVGEKVPVDGVVIEGKSEIDTSIITGESMPVKVSVGSEVFAGSINLMGGLKLRITGVGENTMLNEIIKLIENASQLKSKYVVIADRVASYYTPIVFSAAILTFLMWFFYWSAPINQSALYAVSVLIVTCPCALGLAAPIVQVVSVLKLMKEGIIMKSANALERLSGITDIVFDKTGTITYGLPVWLNKSDFSESMIQIIVSMATRSNHPLMKSIVRSGNNLVLQMSVEEERGMGLKTHYSDVEVRLGNRNWCGITSTEGENDDYLEVWFQYMGGNHRLIFQDAVKEEAPFVIRALKKQGYQLHIYSGDREHVVAKLANVVGIGSFAGALTPADKYHKVQYMQSLGKKVLMIGDGLNDSPALKLADISMAPGSAIAVTLSSADLIFQKNLHSVERSIKFAQKSVKLMKQNFILSFIYNFITVPVAVFGFMTPFIAAAAMALSSVTVVLNAMRLNFNGNKNYDFYKQRF